MIKQVYIDHTPCPEFIKRQLVWSAPLFCCCLFLSVTMAQWFATCHRWGIDPKWLEKHMYGYQLCVKEWWSWSILIMIHVPNSQIGSWCSAHHCFAVVAHSHWTKAVNISHRWWIKSEWLKKHMCDYQFIFKWYSRSTLIIIHAMNLQFGICCNAHHCIAAPYSYLTQRPTFSTGEECSQSYWRSTYMSTNLFWNCVDGLYWS
jgi:hypothetical protein